MSLSDEFIPATPFILYLTISPPHNTPPNPRSPPPPPPPPPHPPPPPPPQPHTPPPPTPPPPHPPPPPPNPPPPPPPLLIFEDATICPCALPLPFFPENRFFLPSFPRCLSRMCYPLFSSDSTPLSRPLARRPRSFRFR